MWFTFLIFVIHALVLSLDESVIILDDTEPTPCVTLSSGSDSDDDEIEIEDDDEEEDDGDDDEEEEKAIVKEIVGL